MQRTILRAWAKARFHGLENFHAFLQLVRQRKWTFVGILIAVIFIIFYSNLAKAIFLMALFITIGVISLYYMKYVKLSLGVELNLLGTVIIGLLYGTIPAIITGIVTLFVAELITERLTHSTVISFLGMIVIGITIPLFPKEWSITTVGICTVLLYDDIIIPLYLMLGSSPARSGIFLITHILFNIWVFSAVAPTVMNLIA